MTEKKPKIVLSGAIRVPEEIDREIKIEAARRNVFHYEVMADAWECYKRAMSEGSKPEPSTDVSTVTTKKSNTTPIDSVTLGVGEITPRELPWVVGFLNVLRQGALASRALKWNIAMLLRGLGLPYDTKGRLLPPPTAELVRAAEKYRDGVEKFIADSEEAESSHPPAKKKRGGTKR